MELVLKNINPQDYDLIFDLANRLGIQVEERPLHNSVIDDLKDAVEEIKMSERGKIKLQAARYLIKEI